MYLRPAHAEHNVHALCKFVRDNPLGILITSLGSPNFPSIQCTHLPWVFDTISENGENRPNVLRGHLARNNPHAKALTEAAQATRSGTLDREVVVLFNGPAHSYVTPKFYVKTKPETGKVVPTWDYSAVQITGKAKIHFDTHSETTSSFLQRQIEALTQQSEAEYARQMDQAGQTPQWEVSDAPKSYVDVLKKNIIGIEIAVERIEGKYKMSQEMGQADREGVVEGFRAVGTELGSELARTIEERGAIKDQEAAKK